MKKIFLPLLALCGMVAGLTLTSCGGGGGGAEAGSASFFAGKTYGFLVDGFGGMSAAFYNDPRGNAIQASIAFAESSGAGMDTEFDQPVGDCVMFIESNVETQDGTTPVVIKPMGIGTDAAQEECVLIFLGFSAEQGENIDIKSCGFEFHLPHVPQTKNEGTVAGMMKVTEFDVEIELPAGADEEDEEELEEQVKTTRTLERDVYCYRIQ